MKIFFICFFRMCPFYKTGGAYPDVVGSLPKYFLINRHTMSGLSYLKYRCMYQEWKGMMQYVDHFYMKILRGRPLCWNF